MNNLTIFKNEEFGEIRTVQLNNETYFVGKDVATALGYSNTITSGIMGLSSAGSGISEAYQSGASDKEATIYGISSGVIDAGTEMLFGGLGKAVNAVGLSKGISSLDDMFARKLSSKLSNQVAKNFTEYGVKASAEGFEEVLAGLGSAVAKKLTYMDEKELSELVKDENLLEQFVVGTATSGMMQSGYIPKTSQGSLKEANKTGRDFITGYTQSEQSVIDKVVENRVKEREKDGKKLGNKEIGEIKEQVEKDLERGYIDTDTIESVIGGETYNKLKSVTDEETKLQEEYDSMKKEFDTLNKMKIGEMTGEQTDRKAELKNQLEELKEKLKNSSESQMKTEIRSQLDSEMLKIVEGTKLSESYNERARRGQELDVDVESYKNENAKQTAQNFKDFRDSKGYGVNNTNATHDYLDMLTRVAEDRGHIFKFMTTKQLEEAVAKGEYKIEDDASKVEAFVDGKAKEIVINMDANKSLSSLVGHEITHTLESDKTSYDSLQKALFSLAETRGEYAKRWESIQRRYSNLTEEQQKQELTSDLVGDYVFGDSDFIANLSTENPNIFKKIYNEIKYLWKMATAGSKEQRQLETAKKKFEDAWRSANNTSIDSDVKFFVSEKTENVSDRLSNREWNQVKSAVADYTKLNYHYEKSSNGDIIIPVNNKLVYTDANFDSPGIKKVVEFDTEYEDEMDIARGWIYEAEKNKSEISDAYEIIENIVGNEFIFEYIQKSSESAERYDRRTSRGKSKSDSYHSSFLQERIRRANEIIHSVNNEQTSSEDGVFFDAPTKNGNNESGKIQYSFAGENAMIADKSSLENAKSMNAKGVSSEDIRLETGWHKGYDGKWRFEIDDSQMEIKDIESNYMKLDQLLKHDKLFEAYPILREVDVVFQDIDGHGKFNRQFFTIDLNSKLKNDNKQLRETLIHEIQHVIQQEEGFANGANSEYWEGRLENGFDSRPNSVKNEEWELRKQYLELQETDPEFAADMEKLEKMTPNVPRGEFDFDTWEQITEDPVEWQKYDAERERLEEKYGEERVWDFQDLKYQMDELKAKGKREASDLYYDTAGEIEARETSRRLTFNENDRKRYQPRNKQENLSRDNVVFADKNNRFRLADDIPTKEYGNHIYSKDVALDIPTKETVQPTTTVEEMPIRSDYAPLTEADANVRDDRQIDEHYFLDDMPTDVEDETYNGNYAEHMKPADPFYEKDIWEVGRDRKQKAYMYENPEVKPFFQAEANYMLGELNNSQKGEKFYNDQLYYDTNGEMGWFGTQRFTSEDIAYLLDTFNYTYKDVEKGLKAIIEDNGKENNAISKRIEFLIDERLRTGYTEFMFGDKIPPNQDYINLLNAKEITQYNDESWNNWLRNLSDEDVATLSQTREEIAPPSEYLPIRPEPTKNEQRMARVKSSDAAPIKEDTPVAQILTEEPTPEKKKSRFWEQAMELVADKGFVFENLSKKTKNRELEAKWNFIRYSDTKAQDFIGNGAAGVKSLDSIQKEVTQKGITKELYEYLYHQHNIDRMSLSEKYENTENKPVFGDSVTADVSRSTVEELEARNPELKRYANEIYSVNNYLRNLLVEGGVISQETADLWAEMYPHYVPIRRAGEHGLNINVPLDTGRTGVNAPVKRATGGSTDILPLFDTMAQRALQTYKAVAKNRFGVELKNTLGTTIATETADVDSVIDGVDQNEELLQKGKNGRKPTFTVFEGGEKVTFEITDTMYDALKPTSEALTYTNKFANTVSNLHRGVLTEYNPSFLARNIIKDTQDVLINSQHPAKTYANFPKAIKEMATNGKWYTEYVKNGGEQNTYFDKKTNSFNKETDKKLIKYIGMPFKWISTANNYIEKLPRLAEYIVSREEGRSIETSMLDSARVTTNFAAGGDLTKFLNRNGATFLNASVQGLMQNVRNIREAKMNGLKGWAQLAGKCVVASIPVIVLNSLMWDDDEEYEELSDYVKQNYYVVAKYGDGKFVRIPKGRTLSVIQDALEQTINFATGNDEVDLESFVQLVITNLAPNDPLEDNIISPIKQAVTNKSWYGEELVPTRLQDLPSEEQYDETTDSLSVWLGDKTGLSPYKINYVLDQYSGALGDSLLPLITPAAESEKDTAIGEMLAPIRDAFTTDSVLKNQNVSDFYDKKDELVTNAKRRGATDADILSNKYFNSVNTEIGKLYAEKREIQSGDYTDSEKYYLVKEIQKKINKLSKEALNEHAKVNIDGFYATVGDKHYRLTDDGWTKLTDEQVEKMEEVTSGLGITKGEYWGNKQEYDMQYKYPEKYKVLQDQGISVEEYKENLEETAFIYTDDYSWAADNPEKYTISKVISDDVKVYKKYKNEINAIKGDGAKERKRDYIFSLNLDYGQKAILYRSIYSSKSDKNEFNADIVRYLDSRDDISFEEYKIILEELDMTLHSDGTITW